MAPAWLRGPGQHIGKIPGVPPDPRATGSGTSRSDAAPDIDPERFAASFTAQWAGRAPSAWTVSLRRVTEVGLVHLDDELEQG